MNFVLKLFPSFKKKEDSFIVQINSLTGVAPKNLDLYKLAFRHSSASTQKENKLPKNNERLEFLGDAILGAIIAEHLYLNYPEEDEGFLTSMRSKIVSRTNLNEISQKIGLHNFIISRLDKRKSAKSLNGDTLEALIGAVYLDKGLKEAKQFVFNKLIKEHLCLSELENYIISHKGLIIEWAQKERKQFEFTLMEQWGKEHNMTFKIGLSIENVLVASGEAGSKKRAEEEAARIAFQKLNL